MEQNTINAPRDPWADFNAVFGEVLAEPLMTPPHIGDLAAAEAYASEQMAGAQDTPEEGYEPEVTK